MRQFITTKRNEANSDIFVLSFMRVWKRGGLEKGCQRKQLRRKNSQNVICYSLINFVIPAFSAAN
ncbi:MAG: hypothetical protein DYG83_02945 [Candidatus Brocadia sp. AMX2]|nr:MAG: hypothetical protein EDM70_17440 [Candidatus Brocadia sp. AMX2]MBC6931108.1 hypothetical protein [Candidatus Brocadia sp.]MBL1168114.1 hypothetical protein [Candidatus Brocadia sp. AMX1]MCE7865783.1 hypothetical protein [Candidatus Brocadia sp. AMX2]